MLVSGMVGGCFSRGSFSNRLSSSSVTVVNSCDKFLIWKLSKKLACVNFRVCTRTVVICESHITVRITVRNHCPTWAGSGYALALGAGMPLRN